MRITHSSVLIAQVLMQDPHGRHHGYGVGQESGVRSGALYPTLNRMLADGWLTDGWEDSAEAAKENRRPRRYYQITDLGLARLGALLANARAQKRFAGIFAWGVVQ
jgi:PadR family transcriptional regulator, regulatory protein PadR